MRFYIKTKPKARQASVKKVNSDHLVVSVTSAPIKGAANEQVVEILSDYFDVPKSKIVILKGEKNKEKIVEVVS